DHGDEDACGEQQAHEDGEGSPQRDTLGADRGYGGERDAARVAQVLGRIELVTLQGGQARERAQMHGRGERSRARVGREHDQTIGTRAPVQDIEERGVARQRRAGRDDQEHVLARIRGGEARGRVEDRRVGPEVDHEPVRRCRGHGHEYTCAPRAAAPAATRSSARSGTSVKSLPTAPDESGPIRAGVPRISPTIPESAFASTRSDSGTPTKSQRSGGSVSCCASGKVTHSAHTRASSSRGASRETNASRPRPKTRVPTTRRSRTRATAVVSAPIRTTPASATPDSATRRASA